MTITIDIPADLADRIIKQDANGRFVFVEVHPGDGSVPCAVVEP